MNKVKTILNYLEKRYRKQIDEHPSNRREIFKVLIGTILSQRTRDETTWPANERLFEKAKTPQEMLRLSNKEIERLIYPVGFYRQKAKRILEVSKILLQKGRVPDNRKELMELPGVGYKTSNIVLSYGYGKPVIPVDVHVEVCSKRLGLVSKDVNIPEIEKELERLVPEDKRYLINLGFILFGKEICRTRNPLCIRDSKNCPFSGFCKAYKTKKFKLV